ncbi:alkane 1-monooxygenase [Cognatiyoonia koreensis]|uniref:Alkane 1-monooxygenase n=1 Tax=Cognatiyoonia koreensis TaxID=364200 RepID=A0A1I0RU90_9RHOB|nr:alkane 1-monooxygenase [Cognatiyoonia koreensis]SEW44908.1 alkane 1-monooxygenase [Cognatiyoonia koreensis]
MTSIPSASGFAKLGPALPFWLSLGLIPFAWIAAAYGGWTLLFMPVLTWYLFSFLDLLIGLNKDNADPQTAEAELFWYKAITIIWAPVQILTMLSIMIYVVNTDHLAGWEEWALFAGIGVISGTIGINYSHELMHQKPKLERWLADILLASVLYSHFRSEHLLVHHRYVATPKDPVTARYNEHFWRFFPRVLKESLVSSFEAEKAMLARKNKPWTDLSNPFWRYWALQLGFITVAAAIGGWWGVILFATQAFWAFFQLELVNYIEHYGLTRKHLGDGKYEHVLPRHSWNTSFRASNWLLINLQRHSDHHYKPDRRFPLLQTYEENDAPQLPYGYPVMTMVAVSPTLWRRMMNPRVQAWRARYYPEIEDWTPYKNGTNPMPR